MRRFLALTYVLALVVSGLGSFLPEKAWADTRRCGWFINPSPSSAWLNDKDGEWMISVQGGEQAEGEWPQLPPKQWVRTGGGSYGYGCVCLTVEEDKQTKTIRRIIKVTAKPLSACRKDKNLQEPEKN